jgi:hypothetical protein
MSTTSPVPIVAPISDVAAPELASPELAAPELAAPELAAPELAAPELVTPTESEVAPVTFTMPSLPSVAPVKPNPQPEVGPGAHQPSQRGSAVGARVDQPQNLTSPKKAVATRSRGGGLVRTVALILFAAIVGGGANVGYRYWQTTTNGVAVVFDGTQLETWPQVELPAIRFADSTTLLRTAAGTRTISSHANLVSGDRIVDVTDTDLTGAVSTYTGAEALALAGAPLVSDIFMISDVFPTEAIPFITVLEGVERRLPVGSISEGQARLADQPGEVAVEVTEPVRGSWHYRVIIDIEAFRNGEPAAFETWERRLGAVAVARIEAWVDGSGVVRQLAVDVDGTSVLHTLVSGSAESTKFEVPATPATGVEPASDVIEVTE